MKSPTMKLRAAALLAVLGPGRLFGLRSQQFLSLGTAGTGGIYYPLGGAIAARLSVMDTLRQYTAEVSGGSVENVNRLRERQIDLAFATGNTVFEAATGGLDYDEAVADLRILAPLYPNMTHIVVSRGTTATSLAELAGGTVSVGAAGSGTEQMSRPDPRGLRTDLRRRDGALPELQRVGHRAQGRRAGRRDHLGGVSGRGRAGGDHHRGRAPAPDGRGTDRLPARALSVLRPRRNPGGELSRNGRGRPHGGDHELGGRHGGHPRRRGRERGAAALGRPGRAGPGPRNGRADRHARAARCAGSRCTASRRRGWTAIWEAGTGGEPASCLPAGALFAAG